jgi:DUF2934 family protein
MSAPAYAKPRPAEPGKEIQNPSQQAIAELAYNLWQKRGSSQGSPQEDWLEAERLLSEEPSTSIAAANKKS